MQIIRFIDEHGQKHYGTPAGVGEAVVYAGCPLVGLSDTGRVAKVAKRLAPIVPKAILCIGLNYRKHAEETGAAIPEHPVLFMKNPAALNHPDAAIVIPSICNNQPQVDFECELAVVIGKAARDVSRADALKHVLGYTIGNDVSARYWQKQAGGGQWVRGKSFDTFCPLGPHIVTGDELGDPQSLAVRTRLNGQVMQEANTSDMIFPVAELIHRLSQGMTLLAGTVVLTGTPSGVGMARKPAVFMKHGDVVELEIEGIGTLRNTVQGE